MAAKKIFFEEDNFSDEDKYFENNYIFYIPYPWHSMPSVSFLKVGIFIFPQMQFKVVYTVQSVKNSENSRLK